MTGELCFMQELSAARLWRKALVIEPASSTDECIEDRQNEKKTLSQQCLLKRQVVLVNMKVSALERVRVWWLDPYRNPTFATWSRGSLHPALLLPARSLA